MKTIVHINKQLIGMNAKDGGKRPVCIVKQGSKTIYCREVLFTGPSKLISTEEPLKNGARVWLETFNEVELTDPMTFKDAKAAQ